MEDAPHIVVRTFERLILFPIDACVLVAGVIFLIERAWLFGAFLLVLALFFGMVGQAVPHRKKKSARELYSESMGGRFSNRNHQEMKGRGKGLIVTAFLARLVYGA